MTLRELSDNNNSISTTRWAFCLVIMFDIITIAISLALFIISYFIGTPIPIEIFDKEALLLGLLTGVITAAKGLQGFEHTSTEEKA